MPTSIHYTENRCGVVATFDFEQDIIEILLNIQKPMTYHDMFILQAGFEGGGLMSGIFYCVDKICGASEFCSPILFKTLCEFI